MSTVNKRQHLKIPFNVIEVATENFKTLIGRGGYGSVYKGKLLVSGKETMVAVKRLNERYGQGLKEFLTEIQLLFGQNHPNLVSLVGYCDEGNEKIIVYEYAERGSLDQYIRRSGKSTSTTLTWSQRLGICLDAARGLDYLHSHVGGDLMIIHRDIKSSNILIDENWVGKISDLGLSKLSGFGMSVIVSNGCGTQGYCEPEYGSTGIVTKKSDVYSFGVVLFEVLCGRLCLIDCNDGFSLSSVSAKEYYKNNSLDLIIDHNLKEHIGSSSMIKFAEIAYGCLHDDREQRPAMDVVAKKLEEALRSLVNDELVMNILKEFEAECATDLKKLKQIGHAMCVEMHAGLASEGGSQLKMLISHVDKLPTGDEEGVHYALHLGTRLFRILRVQLGGKSAIEDQESLDVFIPPELMVGSPEKLFDCIATKLADFLADGSHKFVRRKRRRRELGFTFSFPVMHLSIDSGTLIQWTKGFSIEEMVGRDVVAELTRAMDRQGVDIRVSALVNDTVGTLAGGRYVNSDVCVAVRLGSGSNAAYVERAQAIPKWHGPHLESDEMVINMELGNFGSSHLPLTEYDKALDAESLNPGGQIFEKMIASMYLGELLRRVLLRMADEAELFGETIPPNLKLPYILSTYKMYAMHHDTSRDLNVVARELKDVLQISSTPLSTRKIVVEICNIIATRGARLAAAGILGILKKIGRDTVRECEIPKTVIAIDGGLYEHYTQYRQCLENTLRELVGEQLAKHIKLMHFNDGSGIGAALLAASHSQYLQKR